MHGTEMRLGHEPRNIINPNYALEFLIERGREGGEKIIVLKHILLLSGEKFTECSQVGCTGSDLAGEWDVKSTLSCFILAMIASHM